MSTRGSDAIKGLAKGQLADDIISGESVPIDEVDHGMASIRLPDLLTETGHKLVGVFLQDGFHVPQSFVREAVGHETAEARVFGIVGREYAVHSGGIDPISPLWSGSTAWMEAVEIVPCTGVDE